MDTRSTNAVGYTHFTGDVTAQVGSSHGVRLSGGSTGGIIESVGDDADVTLSISAKGAGGVVIGNSSNAITLGNGSTLLTLGATGGQVRMGGSTAPFYGMVRYTDTAVTTPTLFNDTDAGRVAETTHALTGVNSSHFIIAQSTNLPAAVTIAGAYPGSTAGDVHIRFAKGSTVAVAGTTCTVQFLAFRF
mgnify:CR=1 FL=1